MIRSRRSLIVALAALATLVGGASAAYAGGLYSPTCAGACVTVAPEVTAPVSVPIDLGDSLDLLD